jgi:hypothetical protein
MNYWIIATIVICLFIWYIVKCWSKSFEIVNEGALAQEREAILEIIEQERPLEYAHISNIDYRQKKKHIYHFIKRLTDIAGSLVGIILLSPIFLLSSFLPQSFWCDCRLCNRLALGLEKCPYALFGEVRVSCSRKENLHSICFVQMP